MSKLSLTPLGKRVLVKPLEQEEVTKGGLYIPATATDDQKPTSGEVVALGVVKKDDYKFSVKVGDVIYFKKYSPDEIEVEGTKYLVLEEDQIIAIKNN